MEFSARTRRENLARMEDETFDLAVIGGGIVGAGVALDAAARGLSVALVEKGDFASGTSSRSSKLIHGGLRYLQRGEIGLVREALRERETLRRVAPHLCEPTPFLVPVYGRDKSSPLGASKMKLELGLRLYDKMAFSEHFPPHRWLDRDETLAWCPALDANELRGAFLYYDGVTDDARLVVEIIKQAATYGAAVANYVQMGACSGKSALVKDLFSDAFLQIHANSFVNATGVWAALNANAHLMPRLRTSKGIHIILPAEQFASCKAATLIPSLDGQRFHFVLPWLGRILVGTTDTDYFDDLDTPLAEPDEVDALVQAVARSFPAAGVSRRDVIGAFAGLRPLVARDNVSSTDLSRREEIVEDQTGMISVFGGKLTTYRAMAQRVVDLVVKQSGRGELRCCTENIPLGGAARQDAIVAIAAESAELQTRLESDVPNIAAEVVYAARHEMAMTVEDVLERRTRIAILAKDGGAECREWVRRLLTREIGDP